MYISYQTHHTGHAHTNKHSLDLNKHTIFFVELIYYSIHLKRIDIRKLSHIYTYINIYVGRRHRRFSTASGELLICFVVSNDQKKSFFRISVKIEPTKI